jgi:hypothetical protein
MSRTVTLGVEVEVHEDVFPEVHEMDDEELADAAREIMYSAPAFDGISGDAIAELEVLAIDGEPTEDE